MRMAPPTAFLRVRQRSVKLPLTGPSRNKYNERAEVKEDLLKEKGQPEDERVVCLSLFIA
jgi:hypothetical protein